MRNSWKILPKLALALLALVLAAAAGGFAVSLAARSSTPFHNLPDFPVAEYRQGDPVWSTSSYRLNGSLENIILQSKDRKRYLVALKAEGARAPLPVVIPANASKFPLQRQQNLSLRVTVDASGRIFASECLLE